MAVKQLDADALLLMLAGSWLTRARIECLSSKLRTLVEALNEIKAT